MHLTALPEPFLAFVAVESVMGRHKHRQWVTARTHPDLDLLQRTQRTQRTQCCVFSRVYRGSNVLIIAVHAWCPFCSGDLPPLPANLDDTHDFSAGDGPDHIAIVVVGGESLYAYGRKKTQREGGRHRGREGGREGEREKK